MSLKPTILHAEHLNIENDFYDILAAGEIRLLKAIDFNKLSFSLEVVSIENCPSYGALSYVWGDSARSKQIAINGKLFWITQNLYLALDQFRRGIASKKLDPLKQYLWIDAICINQGISKGAKSELSGQVQQMTEIYENASIVYVWLGNALNLSHNTLAAAKLAKLEESYIRTQISMTHKSSHNNWDRNSELADITRRMGMAEAEAWLRPKTQTREAWLGIIALWRSKWWTRAWAHQEGTVPDINVVFYRRYQRLWGPKQSKTKVYFISSDAYTTWLALSVALQIADYIIFSNASGTVELRGSASAFAKLSVIRSQRGKNFKTKSDSDDIWTSLNKRYHFDKNALLEDQTLLHPLDTLNSFRHADCQDPRDKVYAAMGLLPSLRAQIRVDYQLSIIEVYTGVITKLLAAPGTSLEFLGYSCKTHNSIDIMMKKRSDIQWEKFPSWLPNWYLPINLKPLPKVLYIQAPITPKPTRDKLKMVKVSTSSQMPAYNACGRFTIPNAVIGGHLLHSPGWQLDTVRDISKFSDPANQKTTTLTRWRSQLSKRTYPDGAFFDRDLRRVHCADVKFEVVRGLQPVHRGYEIVNTLLQADKTSLTEKDLSEQSAMKTTLTVMSRYRALGLTDKGRLGLIPYCSEIGDKIVGLFGGQALYVLRRKSATDERYEYIGEAYIHGLMDGEVTGMADRGEIVTQVFTME